MRRGLPGNSRAPIRRRRVLVVLSLNLLDAVLDAMETPQEPPRKRRKRRDVEIFNPHPDCLAEIMAECPYLQNRYEEFRQNMNDAALVDRPRVQLAILSEAEQGYTRNAGETVASWQRRLLARYTRNLALTSGDITAGVFDLTVAARSVVDDNYAWEVWTTAGRYPRRKPKPRFRLSTFPVRRFGGTRKRFGSGGACPGRRGFSSRPG